jgi:hypothetical protein
MDKPPIPSRSMILNAACRITDRLTDRRLAAADGSIPSTPGPATVGCFVIVGAPPFRSSYPHHMLTPYANNVDKIR